VAIPDTTDIRRAFGQRLRAMRTGLGYTQEQMAQALGIQSARYSKYEIGRSEAPYEVLVKIASLAGVSLDYLIAGKEADLEAVDAGRHKELREFVDVLPLATVVYDDTNRLYGCNRAFQRTFFPDSPHIVRPGTPREFLLRSWAYAQGHDPATTESFVQERLSRQAAPGVQFEISLGNHVLRIAETLHKNLKLVLVTDLRSRDHSLASGG
jgi:transcriptional regulator with XRE-family HTH domain